MIKSIVNSIIPENIKDIKLVKDSIDVFLKYVIENSNIALDISNLFSEKNEILFDNVIKMFVNNFHLVFSKNIHNPVLIQRLDEMYKKAGYSSFKDLDFDINLHELLNRKFIELSKNIQLSKGHRVTLEYVYDMVLNLGYQQEIFSSDNYEFTEGENVFEYSVNGSLLQEFFEYIVKPLAHPVGWAYTYTRLYELYFIDYFLCEPQYDIKTLQIGCLIDNQNYIDNFITNTGYLPFTDENNNPLGEIYEVNGQEIKNIIRHGINFDIAPESQSKLILNTKVKLIEKFQTRKNIKYIIYFESGEIIESNTNPRSLVLRYGTSRLEDSLLNINTKIKKDYDKVNGHCGLQLDYDYKIVTTIKDIVKFKVDFGLDNTIGYLNVCGAGNSFCGGQNVGDKYVNKNIPATYHSFVRQNNIINSSFKDIELNINDFRRVIKRVINISTSENKAIRIYLDKSKFKSIKSVKFVELNETYDISNLEHIDINLPNDYELDTIQILADDLEIIEQMNIDISLKVISNHKDFLTNGYVFNPHLYFTTSQNSLSDYQHSKETKRVIGNSGCFCYDEFEIETFTHDAGGELNFKDTYDVKPRDRFYNETINGEDGFYSYNFWHKEYFKRGYDEWIFDDLKNFWEDN